MAKATDERRARWIGLALSLLWLAAWVSTTWHLAVEPHDHGVAPEHTHSRGHDAHHHDDDAGSEDLGHHADDHRLPAATAPGPIGSQPLALAPQPPHSWEPRPLLPTPPPPRRDEVAPATDPPPASRRPRAPPVG